MTSPPQHIQVRSDIYVSYILTVAVKDVEMGVDILVLKNFVTVVQPTAAAQERLSNSAANMWNAIKKVEKRCSELQFDLAEERRGRLIDQEKHDNDVAKLEKHLKAASLKPQHGELQALRLEVKRLEERSEDERKARVKSEEKQILQDQKIEKMAKELTVN